MTDATFLHALVSRWASSDLPEGPSLYGWLVGSWLSDTVRHCEDGGVERSRGEIHCSWVLEGRAIQDVWIRRSPPAAPTMYGTTLRVFDPAVDGWRIIWVDPLNQDHASQIGRRQGRDIVQIGEDGRGMQTRWRFTEIAADSFHWLGEERSCERGPWRLAYEHLARRA